MDISIFATKQIWIEATKLIFRGVINNEGTYENLVFIA